MPRTKGHDKSQTKRLEQMHTIQFNLRTEPINLEIIRIRITQAIRRHDDLKDLLEPALAEINGAMEMNKQSLAALSELI